MNDEMTNRDQTDEDILTYTVSDEALEAAAGIEAAEPATFAGYTNPVYQGCGGTCG
jgi:hypothetical protein